MTAITRDGIAKLYVATFNRAADSDGLNYWDGTGNIDGLVTSFTSMEEVASAFLTSAEAGVDLSEDRAAVVAALYENVLGREGNDSEINYWTNVSLTPTNELVLAFTQGALGPDNDYLNNKAEVASAFADAGLTDVAQAYSIMNAITADDATVTAAIASINEAAGIVAPVVGQTIELTSGTDKVTGTSEDDMFDASIAQNAYTGGISNSLSSADVLDGGDGTDTLTAQIVSEFIGADDTSGYSSAISTEVEITPTTTSIENVTFENIDDNTKVTIDAKHMTAVEEIGSLLSDGDVVIENLTTLTDSGIESEARNTSDLTITMDHTDNYNTDGDASDLTVYLDDDYLISGKSTSGSELLIRMLNAVSNVEGGNPVEGYSTLDFLVGETLVTVDISDIAEDATLDYTTAYDAVVAAINTQLALDGFTGVSAAIGTLEDALFSIPVSTYASGDDAGDYYTIIVTNEGSENLGEGQFVTSALEYNTDQNNSMSTEAATTSQNPLSIDIELEKVGRGGEGGNLVVGSKSQDDEKGAGIPIFNISVLGDATLPSSLGQITSTNDTLTTVDISSATNTAADATYASLEVRGEDGVDNNLPFGGTLDTLDADDFLGDLSIGTEIAASNIDTFTAMGGGDIWLDEDVDGIDATVDTGAGEDMINIELTDGSVDISTGAAADDITVSVDADSNAVIVSGAGDDEIEVDGTGTATITAGTGADEIIGNTVTITVDAGAGDDVIYADNSGDMAEFVLDTTFTASDAADQADLDAHAGQIDFLYKAQVQVTLETSGVAADAFTNGFESELITIMPDTGYLTTQADVNAAIIEAINTNDVLKELAHATTDASGGVLVTYLVDGEQVEGSIKVDFFAAELTASEIASIESEFEVTYKDSDYFEDAPSPDAQGLQDAAIASLTGDAIVSEFATNTLVTALVPGTPAVYTIDTAAAALDTLGDTFTLTVNGDIETVVTAAASMDDAAIADAIFALGTVDLDGVIYDIAQTGGAGTTELVLTAQTSVLANANAITLTSVDGDSSGAIVQPTTPAPTQTTAGTADVPAVYTTSDGADSADITSNVINGGANDDVIVLDSTVESTDTVVYTNYNQGYDTVVHFDSDADSIDLSAYLTNTLSASTSSASQVVFDAFANTGTPTLSANSVNVESFTGIFSGDLDTAATVDFANLTASEVEAALESANGYATAATTNLYQDNAVSILILENDEQATADGSVSNLGEYKIFEVTYSDANEDAGDANFSVELIGTMDVGDTAFIAAGDITA